MTDRSRAERGAAAAADCNRRAEEAQAWITRHAPGLMVNGQPCSFAVAVWMRERRRNPSLHGQPLLDVVTAKRAAWMQRLEQPAPDRPGPTA